MNSRRAIVLGLSFLACGMGISMAEAGGRRCHCQQYASPAVGVAAVQNTAGGQTTRYQSAYQAPATPANSTYYYAPLRPVRSAWDQQVHFARHIKGLE